MSNLAPVPSEGATCANCSAPLVPDQRYCLSCGQPTSPVRLAFLDVLTTETQPLGVTAAVAAPAGYAPPGSEPAGPDWMRRYAPLFAIVAVLLLAMVIGLLVGHWVTQGKSNPGPSIVKVEGLGAAVAPTAGAATTTPSSSATSSAGTSPTASKEEKEEEAEAKAEEKKPAAPPKPKTVSATTLNNLTKSTGKKHQEEINKIGTAPIAVP
jgi:hypothetical protein